jgi:hypothetical protein
MKVNNTTFYHQFYGSILVHFDTDPEPWISTLDIQIQKTVSDPSLFVSDFQDANNNKFCF